MCWFFLKDISAVATEHSKKRPNNDILKSRTKRQKLSNSQLPTGPTETQNLFPLGIQFDNDEYEYLESEGI